MHAHKLGKMLTWTSPLFEVLTHWHTECGPSGPKAALMVTSRVKTSAVSLIESGTLNTNAQENDRASSNAHWNATSNDWDSNPLIIRQIVQHNQTNVSAKMHPSAPRVRSGSRHHVNTHPSSPNNWINIPKSILLEHGTLQTENQPFSYSLTRFQ
jgi:hypothetical protein